MFSDVFTLHKRSWHSRLMKYTWNIDCEDFTHLCPYFWLSIFNVIISPIVLPLKFFFGTILPDYIWKYTKIVLKFIYGIIEAALETFGDWLDKKAVEYQKKWEAKRESELKEMKESAIVQIAGIPDQILHYIEEGYKGDNWSQQRAYQYSIEEFKRDNGKKKGKKWKRWLELFIELHRIDPETWNKLVGKKVEWQEKKEQEKKEQEKKGLKPFYLPMQFVKSRELTPAEIAEKEEWEKRWKEKNDKRKAEAERKEALKEEKRKLREEELLRQKEEWETKQKLRKEERDRKEKLREERRKLSRIKNKQRINRILKIAKPVSVVVIWILGSAAALIGLYLLYKGGVTVIHWIGGIHFHLHTKHIFWVTLWGILKWILLIVGTIVGLFAGIFYLVKWLKTVKFPKIVVPLPKVGHHISDLSRKIPLTRILWLPTWITLKAVWRIVYKGFEYLILGVFWPFYMMWHGAVAVFKAIKGFFRIIKQTYKNECPAIDWKD